MGRKIGHPTYRRKSLSASFGRNQTCATGSASASFHDQKTVITNFRWTALAEPVAHENLLRKQALTMLQCRDKETEAIAIPISFSCISVSPCLREKLLLRTNERLTERQGWADENVCDCVIVVSKHLHSPSGRVGPEGPERAIRFARKHVYPSQDCPTRPLPRPTSPQGGKWQGCKHFRKPCARAGYFF